MQDVSGIAEVPIQLFGCGPGIERAISNEFHQRAIAGDRRAHRFHRYCLVPSAKLLVMAADDTLKLFLLFLQILKCPAMILQGLLLGPLEGDASQLGRCFFQLVEQYLVLRVSMLAQRGKGFRHGIEHAALALQQDCSCQYSRL